MEIAIGLYRTLLGNRAYLRSLAEGAAFLAASTIAIFAAVSYATVHASNFVTDFVLSRVGPFNVRFLFVYGTFTAFAITASLLVWRPNRVPFALKAMALFLLVRAVFVALTHMAPSPIDPQKPAPFFNSIFYGSDLFFSGHTGLPFLAALAFRHIPQWRTFYLALTAFFGAVVLLGHYHYSIDVLAALFITHGVFQISCWLFARDYTGVPASPDATTTAHGRYARTSLLAALGLVLGAAFPSMVEAQEVLPFPPTPSASTTGLTMQDSMSTGNGSSRNGCSRERRTSSSS